MRVRQASSSSAVSRWKRGEGRRPAVTGPRSGPPAQMRGGSNEKAPRSPSM